MQIFPSAPRLQMCPHRCCNLFIVHGRSIYFQARLGLPGVFALLVLDESERRCLLTRSFRIRGLLSDNARGILEDMDVVSPVHVLGVPGGEFHEHGSKCSIFCHGVIAYLCPIGAPHSDRGVPSTSDLLSLSSAIHPSLIQSQLRSRS